MSLTITTTEFALSATQSNLAQLGVSGATGTVVWSLVPPSRLPGRLSMGSDGRITGIPGIIGTFDVVVAALDLGPVGSTSAAGGDAGSIQALSAEDPPGPAVGATVTLTIS